MTNYSGATKVIPEPVTDYQAAGRALTQAATQKLTGHCSCCGTDQGTCYLWHLSVQDGSTLSTVICHDCAKKVSVYDHLALVLEQLLSKEEGKRTTLQ